MPVPGRRSRAVTGLHAQAKPPVYLVSEIEVTNPAAYGAEFAPQAQAAIKAAGGRLIAIGGVAGAGAKPLIARDPAKAGCYSAMGQP